MTTQGDRLLRLARKEGFVRTRDLVDQGIHRETLSRMVASGEFEKVARGVYRLKVLPVTEYHSLALVAKRVDGAVICLLSALAFHEMTTQLPSAVWVGLGSGRSAPRVEYPSLEVTYMAGDALTYGVETHKLENVEVRITGPAKTVADSFKYRNKVGLDVALEALRDYWTLRKGSVDDLLEASEICRVSNTLRPYLEAVIG